jgi:hypothetical protein
MHRSDAVADKIELESLWMGDRGEGDRAMLRIGFCSDTSPLVRYPARDRRAIRRQHVNSQEVSATRVPATSPGRDLQVSLGQSVHSVSIAAPPVLAADCDMEDSHDHLAHDVPTVSFRPRENVICRPQNHGRQDLQLRERPAVVCRWLHRTNRAPRRTR